MKRNHTIKIRVDDQELDQLKEKYQGQQLAVAMRNASLDNYANRQIRIDPRLLRQLSALGNNLNQIPRQCNAKLSQIMLVKFFARGKGREAGPVDYLLGKDRARQDATLLRGDVDQIVQLIDSHDFTRKYTSGVLSFSEPDITDKQKDNIID
jgi:hypothetical protein